MTKGPPPAERRLTFIPGAPGRAATPGQTHLVPLLLIPVFAAVALIMAFVGPFALPCHLLLPLAG